MPICIECRYPVKTLYTEYSGADDRSSGHGVRLTVCKNCGRFCDKYVEHDFVVLFIDLVLIKPQVSLAKLFQVVSLHNTPRDSPPSLRCLPHLGADRKANIQQPPANENNSNFLRLAQQPIVFQYVFFLILCALSTLSFHLSIRFLTSSPLSPLVLSNLIPRYPRPNSVSTALLVSSSTKLFPILMVIWEYDVPAAARSLGWAVVANNVEALKILLDCGYGTAAILATVGAISRWMVGRGILWVAGLDGVDSVGDSGVASDGKALWAVVELGREWGGRLGLG
ncbi:Protein arv1 [Lachnellula arida]|uniref:Protein ARV n=1 Tax=Lachnellula arida TaxID=1316785 RepID=A0A8T9BNS6_9HELO|nr:Protein arv1 [Lachnellula arida]